MKPLALLEQDPAEVGHYMRGWRRCDPAIDGNLAEWSCSGGRYPGRAYGGRQCPVVPTMEYTINRRDGSKRRKRYCDAHYNAKFDVRHKEKSR